MEVSASLRLWGGEKRLMHKVIHGSEGLGWSADDALAIASGPTGRAAYWQALGLQEHCWNLPNGLEALPLSVIEELHPHLEILARMGIHTIGQFKKLPRHGITRRFGASALNALDAAEGRRNESYAWIEQPVRFHLERELPARAEQNEMIERAFLPCLHALSAWLLARQAGVMAIELQLLHDGPPHSRFELRCAGPTRDVRRFSRILSERLIRFRLPRPAYGIATTVNEVIHLPHRTEDFLGSGHESEQAMHELIERLQARLGTDRVCQLSIEDEHRPEKVVHYNAMEPTSASSLRRTAARPLHDIGQMAHRPAWLLRQPLPLAMQQHRPAYHGPLQLLCGPERIEAGWWEETPGSIVQRDYFIARSPQQSLLWIFRTPAHDWYLHGFFS